jgi:hypothetical protein
MFLWELDEEKIMLYFKAIWYYSGKFSLKITNGKFEN